MKATKLSKQEVPTFFPLTSGNMEVILNNEEMLPQQLLKEKDVAENTKFWLKFTAGYGSNKQSSILAIDLPTCTTIASAMLHKQISKAWEGNDIMNAIPSALPTGPSTRPTPEKEAAETTTTTATKGILKPTSTSVATSKICKRNETAIK